MIMNDDTAWPMQHDKRMLLPWMYPWVTNLSVSWLNTVLMRRFFLMSLLILVADLFNHALFRTLLLISTLPLQHLLLHEPSVIVLVNLAADDPFPAALAQPVCLCLLRGTVLPVLLLLLQLLLLVQAPLDVGVQVAVQGLEPVRSWEEVMNWGGGLPAQAPLDVHVRRGGGAGGSAGTWTWECMGGGNELGGPPLPRSWTGQA